MALKRQNQWALVLGLTNVAYFVVTYGIGWVPGFTGWIGTDNLLALIIGLNLILYYFLKK